MRWQTLHRFDPAIGLVTLLLGINLLAVLGLVSSLRDVRQAIDEQRILETRADARTFETLLAQQHADVSFLAHAPPFATAGAIEASDDPMGRRWARLDLESSLLLFLQSRPAVHRLELSVAGKDRGTVAVNRDGVPQLLPPGSPAPQDPSLVQASWTLGQGPGRLQAWIDPTPLLVTTGPGLRLWPSETPQKAPDQTFEAVSSNLWTPPFHALIGRRHSDDNVAHTVERLADRYLWILIFNVALMPLSLILAALTLRRVRRLAKLESEAAQQAQLRALEGQVRHADRLASLGRFAAGIAHEINNPLEGMANYLHLLDADLHVGSVDDARRWLPRLREGIDRAAGTVRQVLSFAEPGQGVKRSTDLSDIVERTLHFLRRHPDCVHIRLRRHGSDIVEVLGDPQTLGQLVLNLVLNACQAQGRDGEVEVRVAAIGQGHAELLVEDRGPGFPEAIRQHLFEPFQSGRGSLGLGLAVCLGIVVDHGGEIRVEERDDGPGSRVRVLLPLVSHASNPKGHR